MRFKYIRYSGSSIEVHDIEAVSHEEAWDILVGQFGPCDDGILVPEKAWFKAVQREVIFHDVPMNRQVYIPGRSPVGW